MIIKDTKGLSFLYDLSGLSLVDNDEEKVVITDVNDLYFKLNDNTKFRQALSKLITEKLSGKIKTGDVVLIADENFSRKVYCLITIACGKIIPYIIYDVDYDNGNEVIANFTRDDIDILSEYPIFNDPSELVFFVTNISHILAENAGTSNRPLIEEVQTYLEKGLWAAYTDGFYSGPDKIAEKIGLNKIGHSDVVYEKDGKYIAFYDYNLFGDYELVKTVFCEIAKQSPDAENLLFTRAFGSPFTKGNEGLVMARLSDFENDMKTLSKSKLPKKNLTEITKEIIKDTEEPVMEDDFFTKAEEIFEKGIKETKTKKKKKREASFEIQSEVSQKEKDLAIKETIMKEDVKISIPKKIRKQKIAAAIKESSQILNSPNNSYPADWDYVYTIEETSRIYNPTVGQEFVDGKFIINEKQENGMTIHEWNAYFYAHPELSHLVDQVIGHIGGLYISEQELIESGVLLYNPKINKLDYVHEYVVGNVYKITEEFESVKDSIVQVYGQAFYDRQIEFLLAKRPQVKSITAAEEKNVPFIHPLDEVVIDYKINSAAGITFYNNQNIPLIRAEKNRLEAEIESNTINRADYDLLMEEFGSKLQSLSITVFFKQWLGEQVGKLAAYGLPDIDMVNDLYFYGMSYPMFAAGMLERGLIIVPKDKKATDIVTYSDFYEAKDSAKRFVNDLFQDFLAQQITDDDRKKIEYEWNKRYNGYVTANVWKLPIFIRHSKYFKDRTSGRRLILSQNQVTGIKFATIDNSSIMAHEVGYGKSLIAISYMSHCFETGQASNFLLTVPKTLYVNRKWREEAYGLHDKSRDRYIIGAVPIYNIIELGNFSTSEIWGGGESKYKTYSEEEERKINELFQLFTEIGGSEAGKRVSKSQGTATVPKSPYNFRMAVSASNYAWTKLIDKILPEIDKNLFNRSISRSFEEYNAILKIFSVTNLGINAKDRLKNIGILVDNILELRWFYQRHLPLFGPDVDFKGFAAYDDRTRKEWQKFSDDQLPYKYEKDKEGKMVWEEVEYIDKDGSKQKKDVPKQRPIKDIYEEYLLDVLTELHGWIETVIQKMSDFAIYEYGEWKFNSGTHNIILATKEALQNLGFSSNYLTGIIDVVKEITTYRAEQNFDIERAYIITYTDDTGQTQTFKRNPEKVLQKQLQEMIDKISNNMTEDGPRGKFFLENLKIDGFILDEAHIAKKIFTNVKTDANVRINVENGGTMVIKTTSHDIKGGAAPETSLSVFGICQYIKSIGNKPIMLLTATPFSNQPTEIFSMLSLVGIKQLREYGISNIKNFFDLFLKETLKYDFNHSGEFIKRITVEDFRNKELLINLIWSVMDIRRESSLDKSLREKRYLGDKPIRIVFPKLISDSSMQQIAVEDEEEDFGLSECEQLGNVSTIAVVNRINTNTCSIVDQNDTQKKMLSDIEKVVTGTVNPKTQLEYTFDDICPNAAIFNEIEKEKGKSTKTEEEEERDSVVVALRTILNTNIKRIPNGLNVPDYGVAHSGMAGMKYGELVFVEKDTDDKWRIYKKVRSKSRTRAFDTLERVTDEETISETLKTLSKKTDYGVTFKALGMSRAIALSPYLFRCNDLPEPTPENLIKYSPKIEYLVKALKSVKDYHVNEVPKKIKDRQEELAELNAKVKKSQDDIDRISQINKELPQLEAAREVSGQVVYMNMIRFNYYYRTEKGKPVAQLMNIADLIKEYLVNKGWFSEDEVQIVSSNTRDSSKEQYIKDFQDGKIKVLLGTPAIKEGVDLQNKASTMYIMTPDWNPTDMRQIEGRIWRRDNENMYVRIVYVLLDQSVEVFIYAKLEEKSRRLQQIMKERDTIAELEEMSLNPNEAKVALASDPEKRADIITKLCQAVLMDQRNKINKSREELNRVSDNIDVVYNNIEIIKNQYLIPYHKAIPEIDKAIYDHQMKSIIDSFVNNKENFINKFARSFYNNEGNYGGISRDNTLTLGLNFFLPTREDRYSSSNTAPTMEQTLLWLTTSDISAAQDIINGLEAGIENRDLIIGSGNYISWDTVEQILPMKQSTQNQWHLLNDYLSGRYDHNYTARLFKLPVVIFAYTDEMRARLLETIKEVKAMQAKGNVSRYDIKDKFQNLSVLLIEDLRTYVRESPLIRPENYVPYQLLKRDFSLAKVKLTEDQFDSKELIKKIDDIQDLYSALDKSLRDFSNFSINTKRDVISVTSKITTRAEILVSLGLAVEDKGQQNEITQQLEALFKPVLKINTVLREIESSFLRSRGMKIDDLPMLVKQYNADYDAVTKKMDALEASRQKLIERFRKTSEQRKTVTIDQIVAKFAETNTYLNNKLEAKI